MAWVELFGQRLEASTCSQFTTKLTFDVSDSPASQELHQFVARHIGSVEQLEILCLLCGHPNKAWSVQEVFRVIQSSEQSVADRLESFLKQGFLELDPGGGYRYSPKRPELAKGVARLAQAYLERRVTIVEMIYRRRPDTLQDFANAFKLRKDN